MGQNIGRILCGYDTMHPINCTIEEFSGSESFPPQILPYRRRHEKPSAAAQPHIHNLSKSSSPKNPPYRQRHVPFLLYRRRASLHCWIRGIAGAAGGLASSHCSSLSLCFFETCSFINARPLSLDGVYSQYGHCSTLPAERKQRRAYLQHPERPAPSTPSCALHSRAEKELSHWKPRNRTTRTQTCQSPRLQGVSGPHGTRALASDVSCPSMHNRPMGSARDRLHP